MRQGIQKRKLRRLPWVLETTGNSRSSWYAKVKAKKAPQPIPIGDRSVAWDEDEIYEYNESLIEQARGAA